MVYFSHIKQIILKYAYCYNKYQLQIKHKWSITKWQFELYWVIQFFSSYNVHNFTQDFIKI